MHFCRPLQDANAGFQEEGANECGDYTSTYLRARSKTFSLVDISKSLFDRLDGADLFHSSAKKYYFAGKKHRHNGEKRIKHLHRKNRDRIYCIKSIPKERTLLIKYVYNKVKYLLRVT